METIRDQAWWEQAILRWRASGFTQKIFCHGEHLSFSAFRYWKDKLAQDKAARNDRTLVEIQKPQDRTRLGQFRITLSSGVTIEPAPGTGLDELRAVVRALISL